MDFEFEFTDFVDAMDEPRLFYKMLRTYPSCVNLESEPNGNTLLHHAAEKINTKAVMMLLDYESNPWKENRKSSTTPLNMIIIFTGDHRKK